MIPAYGHILNQGQNSRVPTYAELVSLHKTIRRADIKPSRWRHETNTPSTLRRNGGILKHYSDVIMSAMVSQITGASIVYSTVCSTQINENTKTPHHWPLWGEFTDDREFPAHTASNAEYVSIWWHRHKNPAMESICGSFFIISSSLGNVLNKQGPKMLL